MGTIVGGGDLVLHGLLVRGTYLRVPVEVRDLIVRAIVVVIVVGDLVVLKVKVRVVVAEGEEVGEDVSTLDRTCRGGEGDAQGKECSCKERGFHWGVGRGLKGGKVGKWEGKREDEKESRMARKVVLCDGEKDCVEG